MCITKANTIENSEKCLIQYSPRVICARWYQYFTRSPTKYSSLCKCCHWLLIFVLRFIQLRDTVASKVDNGNQEIDILHWTSRVALEIIGQTVWEIYERTIAHSTDIHAAGPRYTYLSAIQDFQLISPMSFRQGYSFDSFGDDPPNAYILKNLMSVPSFPYRVTIYASNILLLQANFIQVVPSSPVLALDNKISFPKFPCLHRKIFAFP